MDEFDKNSKKILDEGAEYIDVRLAETEVEDITFEDSILSSVKRKEDFSYGIRVFYKGAWGFVYGTKIEKFPLLMEKAWKIAKTTSKRVKKKFKLDTYKGVKDKFTLKVKKNPLDIDIKTKIKDLMELDRILKKKGSDHRTIRSAFTSSKKIFYNTEGSNIEQNNFAFNFRAMVVGNNNGNIVKSFERVGKKMGYEGFEKLNYEKIAQNLQDKLQHAMKAKPAPAGRFPVIINNGLCEVFFHEAVGHACEADAILEDSSVLKNKIGNKIAINDLNLVDTPLIEDEFGYYKYDDEGISAKRTFLIKRGILRNFMQNRETASIMGVKPSGNGRAESPVHIPYPRMTNTVLEAGDYRFKELFENIKYGIYAKDSSGGEVDPNNGNFLFNAAEAFLIENGKITKPLKDVSLAGNILDTLSKIEKIGNDSNKTFFGGFCGKKGQWVPVGGKAPHVKISEVMVGGQNI